MNRPTFTFTIAEDCGMNFLLDASFRLNSESAPKDLTKLLPRSKPVRAMIIGCVLTAYQGEDFSDKDGFLEFCSESTGPTWINTMASSFQGGQNTRDFFEDYFNGVQFFTTRRGNLQVLSDGTRGGKHPLVRFSAFALPPANIRIFTKQKPSHEPRIVRTGDLPALAERLEAFQIKRSGDWMPIVSKILKSAEEMRPWTPSPSLASQEQSSINTGGVFTFELELRPKIQKPNGQLTFDLDVRLKKPL
jgi:hypothetical protein